jgi:hypothetical protein
MLAALGAEHPHVFYARLALGRALVRVGRPREAIALLELAAKTDLDTHGRAEAELELAKALDAAQQDPDRVVALARSARERYVAAGVIGAGGVRDADAFLAERER